VRAGTGDAVTGGGAYPVFCQRAPHVP
jgi:hypothetical protein